MRILHFALPFSLESSKGAGAEHDKSICRLEIIPQCAVGLNLPAALSSDTRLWENLFSHSLPWPQPGQG